jgi:phage I-like protein
LKVSVSIEERRAFMAQTLGYMVDLSGYKFDDGAGWIHAVPLGKWQHPQYGEIDITPDRVQRFADNIKRGVRGQDLDIDYDHKAKGGEAAGWVKDADARGDGLWLLVEWTRSAWAKIKEKAYRYFSPELVDEWTHPQTGEKYQDVLFGGGLTNRPFLKGILPINLSELLSEHDATESVGGQMDPKLIRQLLGLPEDATDDQVTSQIQELTSKKEEKKQVDGQLVLASEIKKLAEENPAVKELAEALKETQQQLAEVKASAKLSEATSTVQRLTEPVEDNGTRIAFSEPVREALKDVLLLAEGDLQEKVVKLFDELRKGIVPLGETGSSKAPNGDTEGSAAIKQFADAVQTIMTERELSYGEAASALAREKPQLFAEYREATTNV